MRKLLMVVFLAGLVSLLSACSTGGSIPTQSFVRENANLGLLQKIAVMPFEGGGRAQRIRELAMTQLLATGLFDVIDKGRVDVFLQQDSRAPGAPLDVFALRRLGETLDVQAVLLGSVEQTTQARGSASFPEMTMTLRIVQCETGQLLWQASGSASGYSLSDRLFGFAPKDSFEVTMDLLDELFDTMIVEE